MSEYTPDNWVIVEISGTDVPETYHRILAGWHGGYLYGDSWKMSSGVTKIVDCDTHWAIHNHSGSIYNCHKNNERLAGMTFGVLNSYSKENSDTIKFDVVKVETLLETYCEK